MQQPIWEIVRGNQPFVAVALHHGHAARPDVEAVFALDDLGRLREEDPFTGGWTVVSDTRVVVHHSRFEMDLNRSPEKAVYINPEDAWGLQVWKSPPSASILEQTRAQYNRFYADMRALFESMREKYGKFVVYDLHSYNHMRDGADGPPADPAGNPEVNVGTGTMLRRDQWAAVIDRFSAEMRAVDYLGRKLDVRENIKFVGGHFGHWTHTHFPDSACVLSIEFKKFFMDEWTGQPDPVQVEAIQQALKATVPGVLEALQAL